MLQVQPRTMYGIVCVAFGSDISQIPVINIRISSIGTSGLVFAKDLWEDAYAFETSVLLFAHFAKPKVYWLVEDVNGEIFQNLSSAVVREGIRVGAGVSGGEEHNSGVVIIGRHIRYLAIVGAMLS